MGGGEKSRDRVLGYSSISRSGDEKDPAKETKKGPAGR